MLNEEMSRNEITRYVINVLNLKPKFKITSTTEEMAFHCPFHKDKTPSMFINFNMGVYNCFSCGKKGSVESLYYDLTGQSLRKALGLSNDKFVSYAVLNNNLNRNIYEYLNQEENFSLKDIHINMNEKLLEDAWNSRDARNYLLKRGISKKVSYELSFKYSKSILINGTLFKRRLIIPIYENHKMIAVEGRRIFSEDPDPKVLYAKNCSVNTLFDIDNLNKKEDVFAVEGLMDLAILRNCKFFKNSTSIFGANLTNRQLKLISTFKKFIYINDNDEAGRKTLEKLKKSGLDNVYYLEPPKSIKGVFIKDIGDLPKVNLTPQDLLEKKWLSYIKKIN